MSDVPKVIGTVVLAGRDHVSDVVSRFSAQARAMGFETVDAVSTDGVEAPLDLIVGVGGDGTLLRAAHLAHDLDVPVIGINLGTVGYLTEVEPEHMGTMLTRLAEGDLGTHSRMTVAATTADGHTLYGINDVVMEKVLSQRLVPRFRPAVRLWIPISMC
jgi:NAD+ kinase